MINWAWPLCVNCVKVSSLLMLIIVFFPHSGLSWQTLKPIIRTRHFRTPRKTTPCCMKSPPTWRQLAFTIHWIRLMTQRYNDVLESGVMPTDHWAKTSGEAEFRCKRLCPHPGPCPSLRHGHTSSKPHTWWSVTSCKVGNVLSVSSSCGYIWDSMSELLLLLSSVLAQPGKRPPLANTQQNV